MSEQLEQRELSIPSAPSPSRLSDLMLSEAMRARAGLGARADRVAAFLASRAHPDGGYRGRTDAADLYYTVFAVESLLVLDAAPTVRRIAPWIQSFGGGEDLDFVHLTCLARCRARLPRLVTAQDTERAILARIEEYRTRTGGYHVRKGGEESSAYACFLAYLAYDDIEMPMPAPRQLLRALQPLRLADGGYANETGIPVGNTPATAAAAVLQVRIDEPVNPASGEWLLSCCNRRGGFLAMPEAPEPDLLSTATALFALRTLRKPLDTIRAPCLEFVNGLWDETAGGFCGHRLDRTVDTEYTFYGLLALGCLAE